MMNNMIPEIVDGLPNVSGQEEPVAEAMAYEGPFYLPESGVDFARARSVFANALHMHQPLIPAGGGDLRTAEVISNLQHMMNNPGVGDNHNAPVFHWCYRRMGEMIPQLVHEGKRPRILLDYSGNLLYGLRKMGLQDVFDSLRRITLEPAYRPCVEWLGTAWGHAVAPSTPVQDFRLHVRAWQQYFAACFGFEALRRVRGFSPPEMALPNHPDVAYEFVRTLVECGYRWVLVQEHTVEQVADGGPVRNPHIPCRLVAKNAAGETASITAVIKTQGSDTKLVAQMQPCYEARSRNRQTLAGHSVPAMVAQIADGENGGVMMNEFPSKYIQVMHEASHSDVPPVNVGEYLEYLASLGIAENDFPAIQPILQKRLWDRFRPGQGAEALQGAIKKLQKEDHRFHMEGGSWTSNISWVRGYDHVLGPMEQASALFAEKVLARHIPPNDPRYRNALYHLMIAETSCFRYWGSQGLWTEYGKELCRRTIEILQHDM